MVSLIIIYADNDDKVLQEAGKAEARKRFGPDDKIVFRNPKYFTGGHDCEKCKYVFVGPEPIGELIKACYLERKVKTSVVKVKRPPVPKEFQQEKPLYEEVADDDDTGAVVIGGPVEVSD